jgi:hypothetical protein
MFLRKPEVAGLKPTAYNRNDYIDPGTGGYVARSDNRTTFSADWVRQQQNGLPSDLHSWINSRLES